MPSMPCKMRNWRASRSNGPMTCCLTGRRLPEFCSKAMRSAGCRFVIIGMGVNMAHHPGGYPSSCDQSSLQRELISDPHASVATFESVPWKRGWTQWSAGNGFSACARTGFPQLPARSGQSKSKNCRVRRNRDTGNFGGIDENGLLLA